MSILADTPLPSPVTPYRRWRPTRRQIAAFVAVLLLGGGIGWLLYIHQYQPLGPGGIGGAGPNIAELTDGINTTAFIATGKTGSVSRLDLTIRNSGHFDVTLLGLDSSFEPAELAPKIRFLPVDATGAFDPADPRWTSRPVTLHAGQTMGLELGFSRPSCPADGGYGGVISVPIRWEALGVHHIYYAPISDFHPMSFYACYPREALTHVYRF